MKYNISNCVISLLTSLLHKWDEVIFFWLPYSVNNNIMLSEDRAWIQCIFDIIKLPLTYPISRLDGVMFLWGHFYREAILFIHLKPPTSSRQATEQLPTFSLRLLDKPCSSPLVLEPHKFIPSSRFLYSEGWVRTLITFQSLRSSK